MANLQSSLAKKRAARKDVSSLSTKVQAVRNKQAKVTPGKAVTGANKVDKTVTQL